MEFPSYGEQSNLAGRATVIICLLSAYSSWLLGILPAGPDGIFGFMAKLLSLWVENYDRLVL